MKIIVEEKLVSVIIPTYNRDLCYLSRAIKSITRQTYKNHEIIVVDDNIYKSKLSLKIKKYCLLHNITYFRTRGKEGANIARNIGAYYAKGFYLAFLDDDDMWLPNKLEMQLKYFSDDIGMVYSNGYIITSNSIQLYTNSESFVFKGDLYRLLIYNYIGPTITALIKKECFFDVGMFDEDMPSKQDYDLWIRILKKYRIIGINYPLFLYSQHNSYQMTKDYKLIFKGYQKLYEKNINYYKNDFILKFFFYLKIAILYKHRKRYFKYYKYLFRSIACIMSKSLNIVF